MRKVTSLILVIVMIVSTFSLMSCGEKGEDLSTIIEDKMLAYETDLNDSLGTLNDSIAVSDYLYNWGKSKGVKVKYDEYHNVIMSVKASEGYENVSPTVVQCSFDPNRLENNVTAIASALFIAKNSKTNGPLKVIFTCEPDRDFAGVSKLSDSYFAKDTKVICLGQSTKKLVSNNSSAMATYTLSHDADYVKPKNDVAYKIKIEGLNGGIPDTKITSYPNPIKALGDLLAYFKTNSLIYELSKFNGGSSATTYAKDASMTVVINENDIDKFISRMDNVIETFEDSNREDHENFTYTYEKVDTPKKVLASNDNDNFVSLLYTILDGVYYKDDNGDIVSIASVGSIKFAKGKYTIGVSANSLTDSNLTEISQSLETICSLCDAKYKQESTINKWNSPEDSTFITSISSAYRMYSGDTMELVDSVPATACSVIQEKLPNSQIIYMGLSEKNKFDCTGTIIKYLEYLNKDN